MSSRPTDCPEFARWMKEETESRNPKEGAHPNYKFLNSSVVSVASVPFSGGQPKPGAASGPGVLREAGLFEALEDSVNIPGFTAEDVGNIPAPKVDSDEDWGTLKRPRAVGGMCEAVAEKLSEKHAKGNFVLTLGGDHSIAVGTLLATLKKHPDAFFVWVDAHADINTHMTSNSGNIHGMPVAFAMGLHGMGECPGFEWMKEYPTLAPDRIAYIGLRDLDFGEKVILKKMNIAAYSMLDVDDLGIGKVMEEVLMRANGRPIHLSFDVDSVDPSWAPATGTPVQGGLTVREAHAVCEKLATSKQLVAMDMVEVHAGAADGWTADQQTATARLGADLILSALGKRILARN